MSTSTNDPEVAAGAVVTRIGRRLAGARVERGLTQAEVAKQAQTSASRVSEIEMGKASARLGTIAKIARAVGLEVTLRETAAA